MKLYLLKRIGRTDYDQCAGFVVRAENEIEARQIAFQASHYDPEINPGESVWINANESTCELLNSKGQSGVILRDFRAG